MIKIEKVRIQELRGIRDLQLNLNAKSFAVCGPNGSGKSGVVDAIEFGLTGNISRLKGKGTGALSVRRHGPHILQQNPLEHSQVSLEIRLLDLDRVVTVTRSIKDPDQPLLNPDDDKIRTVLREVASHPEIVLSRREVIKFILAEPTERSKEIQALLRLDNIGATRAILKSVQNKIKGDHKTKLQNATDAAKSLCTHLGIDDFEEEIAVQACNDERKVLGLEDLSHLSESTPLDDGVKVEQEVKPFNKVSAQNDINSLLERLRGSDLLAPSIATLVGVCKEIDKDRSILLHLKQLPFLQQGVELIDTANCPFCDVSWESQSDLETHLRTKIMQLEDTEARQIQFKEAAENIANGVASIEGLIGPVVNIASREGASDLKALLDTWAKDLSQLVHDLQTVEGALRRQDRLSTGWMAIPNELVLSLEKLKAAIDAMPDLDAKHHAQTFLTIAQDRYMKYVEALNRASHAEGVALIANSIYDVYCDEAQSVLTQLYEEVESDFSLFYSLLNSDDESSFRAQFSPQEGKLGLTVDFFGQGYYPPSAYHSEGHQDALGVCLYLALMNHLHSETFSLAILDDVVMSVDSGHRKEFCRLLKTRFPNTQFIITTHDRVWASQMRHHGLVTAQSCATFHSWTIDTGPTYEEQIEVWQKIEHQISVGNISDASFTLRNHLEFAMAELANGLRAPIPYRSDGDYDLGDLYSAVVGRYGKLIGKARNIANSWNDEESKRALDQLDKKRMNIVTDYEDDNWVLNKAIHYNEWANFYSSDVADLVGAATDLLSLFQCSECQGWVYISGPKQPDALRCDCSQIFYNLVLPRN
ncbi:MAG: AAA family ATPase [Acidimicrobiia bacterium]|nr:AAA family ATPase [Acidimicrobiia bacterium]MCY4435020.1 AAA family ATPase [bacterium]